METNAYVYSILISLIVLGLIMFFILNFQSESYIKAGEINLFKLPKGAYDIFIDYSKSSLVQSAYQENRLLIFVGEAISSGDRSIDREVARISAYTQIAEYLRSNISVFKKYIEGTLTSSDNLKTAKNEIISVAENAYNSLVNLAANGNLSGVIEYANWKYKDGNQVRFSVLVIYDPKLSKQFESNAAFSDSISFLKNVGMDFFDIFSQAVTSKGEILNNIIPNQGPSSSKPSILVGIGDGYGKTQEEAEKIARTEALKRIAEQIYVEVDSKLNLKEIYKSSGSQQTFNSEYEKIIQSTSKAELYGVTYTNLETKREPKGFYVRVKAEIRASDAFQNFKANLLEAIIRSLRSNKLIFSAKDLLVKEDVESYNPNLPAVSRLLIEKGLVERDYRKALELIGLIKSKDIRNLEEAIDVGNLITELEVIALDYPGEILSLKSKVYEFAKSMKITLKVQRNVWKDERVYITLSLPDTTLYKNKEVKLFVSAENCSIDSNIVVLRKGEGQTAVNIDQINARVSFHFGGRELATWTPKVYDSQYDNQKEYQKELICSCGVVLLFVNQDGSLTNIERNEIIKKFQTEVNQLSRKILKENELDIKILDLNSVENIMGSLQKFNPSTFSNQVRKYKIARYIVFITPNFNFGRVGNWISLNLLINIRIDDLMSNESFSEYISKDSLSTNEVEALGNILSSIDFLTELRKVLTKYLKF